MSDPADDPTRDATAPDRPTAATIRRAPRIGVFLGLGAAIGIIATLVLTSLYPAGEDVGFAATFGYFLLYGVPAGVLLGALVALVLDRISRRRARTVTVEREQVAAPVEVEPEPEAGPEPAPRPAGEDDTP